MKFLVLALDFDGTIAQNDVLDLDVRQAIGEVRGQGIVVILVTCRPGTGRSDPNTPHCRRFGQECWAEAQPRHT
jgi:hypothetical protein